MPQGQRKPIALTAFEIVTGIVQVKSFLVSFGLVIKFYINIRICASTVCIAGFDDCCPF